MGEVNDYSRQIRLLCVGLILVSLGLICSNLGNAMWAFGRIF